MIALGHGNSEQRDCTLSQTRHTFSSGDAVTIFYSQLCSSSFARSPWNVIQAPLQTGGDIFQGLSQPTAIPAPAGDYLLQLQQWW